jgi:alginate O-acetyltransferase complex protein AlgI
MIFNSLVFFVFLGIVLPLYFLCRHRWQNHVLLVASYVFYGWWDYRFLALLFLSTVVDYVCGRRISRSDSDTVRRRYLLLSLITNLGCLGFFKYYNFFAESAGRLLEGFGLAVDAPTLNVILPVGISFYTFQSLSYTIDVYRRQCPPAKHFFDFALYVSFFPQLVAGPIERSLHLLPQVESPRTFSAQAAVDGIALMALGYVKKLVIADRLAPLVDTAFQGSSLPFADAGSWIFIYAFAFQIYGDFSGYSDIARGISKVLGFDLMVNFRAPYLVSNPSAFWQHWHISLSSWLRDYLYIPLGGNRHGAWITYRNLMTTMLLGGLWHGAGWAFVIWGLFHGLLLSIHRRFTPLLKQIDQQAAKVPWGRPLWRGLTVVVFFHLTCIGWLIFRAGAIEAAAIQFHMVLNSTSVLLTPPNWGPPLQYARMVLFLGGLVLLFQWKHEAFERFHTWPLGRQVFAFTAALLLITSLGVFGGSQFIYFQF